MVNNFTMIRELFNELKNISKTLQNHENKIVINRIEKIIENIEDKNNEIFSNLKAELDEYKEIFNSTHEAILIIDINNYEIISYNDRSLKIFETLSKEDIYKSNFINLITNNNPDSVKKLKSHFSKALKGENQLFDFQTKRINGDNIWTAISLRKSEIGGNERIIAVVRDINERKETENSLKNSENLLRTLINAMPDIVCFKDGDGKWLEANNYDLQLFELEGIEYKGKKDSELAQFSNFYKEAFLACESSDEIAWQKGVLSRNDEIIPKPDGSFKTFDIIKVPTFDENGKRKGLIVVGRDISDKKKYEESLELAAKEWQETFDSTADSICLLDSEQNIIRANSAFVENFSNKGSELSQRKCWELVHKTKQPIDNCVVAKCLNSKKREYLEFQDNDKYFIASADPIFNNKGEIKAIVHIIRDNTKIKKAEILLKESEERYKLATSASDLGIWDWWLENNTVYYSDQWKKQLGYLPDEIKNEFVSWENLLHPEDKERMTLNVNEFIKNPSDLFIAEFRLKHKNGSYVWIHNKAACVRNNTGKVIRMFGTHTDITNQKKANDALKESELKYRTVVSSSSEGIILQDKNGYILTWNKAAENIFGITEAEALGQTSTSRSFNVFKEDGSVYYGEEHPSMITLKTGFATKDIIMKVLNPNNITKWIKVNTNPIFINSKQQPDYVVITFSDITNLKQIQQTLNEQKEIYSTIVNQANDAIGLIDPENGNFVEFNRKAHEILGYTREEFANLSLPDIEYKHNKEKVINSLKNLISSGESTFETQHIHKNGNVLDIRVSTNSVMIKNKAYITGIWSDITEKKKQEEELKEKNLIFQSLMENSPIYVFFKDWNIKALYLSKNFENMLGMPIENALGKDMNDLFPSELALKMIADDKKIIENGELIQVDEELGGKYYTTIKFPIKRENAPPMLAGFTIDITDRKKTELALKQSEARLTAFMENVPALILIKDHELRPVYANENIKSLFPMNEWMGKTPSETFPEDIANLMIEKDMQALQQGYSSYEETWTDVFGKSHIFHTQKFRIDIPESEPLLGSIITDITEKKSAEKYINELNQTLEKRVEERTAELIEANKELESFAYTVSHDLRAPLRAIDGFTNILKEEYYCTFDENGKKICNTISNNALKMGHLIDDLLAFSRVGRNEMNLLSINTKQLVEAVIQDNFTTGQTGKYQIEIGDLPSTKGDRAMMKQVWINLISNAIKFSSKKEKPVIRIDYKEDDTNYTFSITDNGSGFDQKYADKLFGVFQRLHNESEFEGTGVGLAIVQRIINRHGGKIWAESEKDIGSTFYFTLKKLTN